jgi:ribosomal protein L18
MNGVMRQMLNSAETKPARLSKKGRKTRAGKNRLVDRDSLDGRLAVAKGYDRLVAQIHQDLGGADRLSAMELELVEAFTGASKLFGSLNTGLLAGAEITPALVNMYALSISAMVRTASKLGTARRAKTVPSLNEWLARKAREEGKPSEGEII